ncbi:hypothetical protein NUW54_g3139 [Trametes sanguinea]|uniref:Uncharacterized protein n=1 Tax=Trametes sanguinea TaxID=158606 RepID=A0ACC1Q263_9APHY|nr:hypothetical protein NUW54_g3139 [Trametes sanguinea]
MPTCSSKLRPQSPTHTFLDNAPQDAEHKGPEGLMGASESSLSAQSVVAIPQATTHAPEIGSTLEALTATSFRTPRWMLVACSSTLTMPPPTLALGHRVISTSTQPPRVLQNERRMSARSLIVLQDWRRRTARFSSHEPRPLDKSQPETLQTHPQPVRSVLHKKSTAMFWTTPHKT